MKRPHRRVHFVVWIVLTPMIFLASFYILAQRPVDAVEPSLPKSVTEEGR